MSFPVMRCQIENGCILQTKNDHIFDTRLTFNENTKTAKVSIRPNIGQAPDVINVLRSIKIEKALLHKFFPTKNSVESELDLALYHLDEIYRLFERLNYMEKECNLTFIPASIIMNDVDSQRDLYELWLAMKEKRTIRLNAVLKGTESTCITMGANNNITINQSIGSR